MKADLCLLMAVRAHIFKTGRAVSVNDILINDPLIYQALQLAVHRRLADLGTLCLEVFAYVACRNMHSRYRFQIAKQDLPLLCFIF